MVVAALAILLTLILVIGVHEMGHALVASFFKIKIKKISIGFGRPLIQWKTNNGCEWAWSMWPFGGYVELLNSRISPVDPSEFHYCFDKKPAWIRFLVLIAGVVANLITAWFAFFLVFSIGIQARPPQVLSVQEQSLAGQSGFSSGDQLLSINGHATRSWQEVGMELIIAWGNKEVPILIKNVSQGEKEIHLDLSQTKFLGKEKSLLGSLGMSPNLLVSSELLKSASVADAIVQTNQAFVHTLYFFLKVLKQLFSRVIPFTILLGPLGFFAASVASLKQGVVVFIYFVANLSLAVALVNLFPIPGLDGGSIVYAFIEKIRGKPISVALEVLLHRLVLIAFCVLLIQLLMNDLLRFYSS